MNSTPTISFRCDASSQQGSGHVMRCLSLADAMKARGWHRQFITASETKDMVPSISAYPTIPVDAAPEKTSVLVVDNYNLDESYESAARDWAQHVMVIDDLADRRHDCDILLDQTFGRDAEDYKNLAPQNCTYLCGSEYTILRPQFLENRDVALKKRSALETVKNIVISFGATNPDNITREVLESVAKSDQPLTIDIVMGAQAEYQDDIRALSQHITSQTHHQVDLHINAQNMADFMLKADLAIGAGGTTSWERACLGLPTLMMTLADNQNLVAANLDRKGAVKNLGFYKGLDNTQIDKAFAAMQENVGGLHEMSRIAFSICDGQGVNRIINQIEEIIAS